MQEETSTEYYKTARNYISIHSPRARGDPKTYVVDTANEIFQSTPLMRGETVAALGLLAVVGANFNPLPSCEGRHIPTMQHRRRFTISIHSPRARGDVQRHFVTPFV